MIAKLKLVLSTIPKLGYGNVAYMVWYRLSLKLGWRIRKFPIGNPISGPFFTQSPQATDYPEKWRAQTLEKADSLLNGELVWFNYHRHKVGSPPNWFLNPFDGTVLNNPKKHWTELSDFDLNTGDIKILWEPSRFDWVTDLARAYKITGEDNYLNTLNAWLENWSYHNPKNLGPNWKCGQETAIRVMKLITAAQILDQDRDALPSLQQLIYHHVERIGGNINYALAQDNNHGTSEAAGLYIGSLWLHCQPRPITPMSELKGRIKRGRKLLENRILKLIGADGSFSQHSVTYHRVVVDTLSWVLYAMQRYSELAFSSLLAQRLEKLGEWQLKMTMSESGDAPNQGSNDGAMLEKLHNADYRDFRPSTQLFFATLLGKSVYTDTDTFEATYWRFPQNYLSLLPHSVVMPDSEILDGEYVILRAGPTQVLIVQPNDRFRPASCDAFHVDIWYKGQNLFLDSGSYSYNAGPETLAFKSVKNHNTVQFGDSEQMPKISRFLYGNWLKAENIETFYEGNSWGWSGNYLESNKNGHKRTVTIHEDGRTIVVIDEICPSSSNPNRLFWHIANTGAGEFRLRVTDSKGNELIPEEKEGFTSLYYLHKDPKTTFVFPFTTTKLISTITF